MSETGPSPTAYAAEAGALDAAWALARRLRGLALAFSPGLALGAAAVALAAALRFYHLGEHGLGNSFYAAAVRSMLRSTHNFFFASFDPMGTFMVDKPPLALWLQALSAKALGYDGFALMLPQALAGTAAVAVLWYVARRLHGEASGVAAAAVLAVLPASVLIARNNTMDTLVMALGLGAVACTVLAASSGRLAWALAAGALVGLAFNTKGFEGLLPLPGMLLYYLLASRGPLRARAAHALAAGSVLAAVGLSWTAAVGLTPAGERPIVLNSAGDSIWSLTFGYNGLDRVLGGEGLNPGSALTAPPGATTIPLGVLYGGARGPGRLLGEFPAPLVTALYPAALAGVLLLLGDLFDGRRRAGAALWLSWLAGGLVAFSASRLGSPHYLEAFSPALAVPAGVALAAAATGARWRRLAGLAGAGGSALYCALRFDQMGDAGGAIVVIGLAGTAAAVAAIALRGVAGRAVAAAGGVALLAVMALLSAQAVREAPAEGVLPGTVFLALDGRREVKFDRNATAYYFLSGEIGYLDRPLRYLAARTTEGKYAVAVRSFYQAGPIISQRGLPAVPLYSEFRNRPELPIEDLQALVDSKRLQYFMVSLPTLRRVYPEAAALVEARCRADMSRAAGLAPQTGMQLLYCP